MTLSSGIGLAARAAEPAASAPAAAPAAPPVAQLQEIIVTAERHSVSVQKSSIDISVITPDQVRDAGLVQARDLTKIEPGVQIGQGGPATQIYVRGVGDFGSQPRSNPAVSFNVDGVYVARSTAIEGNFFDVQRIEVVKGPQGTLYGRNATGGAINVITNAPTMDALHGALEGEVGDYAMGRIEGFLNVPVTDAFAVRAAFQVVNRQGYSDQGFDDDQHQSFRLSGLWKPTDTFNVRLTYDHTHVGGVGPAYVVKGPYSSALLPYMQQQGFNSFPTDPRMVFTQPQAQAVVLASEALATANGAKSCYPIAPAQSATTSGLVGGGLTGAPCSSFHLGPFSSQAAVNPAQAQYDRNMNNNFDNVTMELNWRLPFATLTVIPAFRRVRNDYTADPIFVTDDAFRGFPERSDEFSTEARLGHSESNLTWVVGGYYFHESQLAQLGNPGGGPLVYPLLTRTAYQTVSEAGFGQATYSVTPAFRLIAGIRYTNDQKALDSSVSAFDSPFLPTVYLKPVPGVVPPGPCYLKASPCVYTSASGTQDFNQTTYKVGAEYDVAPHNMLYLTYSTGYKAGGLNPFTAKGGAISSYLPETLDALEAGSKNRFFDSKLQVNVAGFYWKYRNAQEQYSTVDANNLPQSGYTNAKDATMYGVDADVSARLTDSDTLHVTAEYLHSRFDNFTYTTPPPTSLLVGVATGCQETGTVLTGMTINCSGKPLTRAPEWSGSAGLTHSVDLGDRGGLDLTVDGQWATSRYLTVDYTSTVKADAYVVGDAYVTYRPQGRAWYLTGYVRNFSNALVYTGAFTLQGPLPGVAAANLAPPRTYGAILGVKF